MKIITKKKANEILKELRGEENEQNNSIDYTLSFNW